MRFGSSVALCAALLLGTAAAIPSASAQNQAQPRVITLSKEERAALQPLQVAINANNLAAAAAALPAARAAAKSADAHYFLGQYQLRLGIGTGNVQMQAQAIDTIVGSGLAPAADLPELYRNQAALAAGSGDLKKAEGLLTRLAEARPNDPEVLAQLAEVKNDLGKLPESVQLLERGMDIRLAAGQPVPESWYKRAVKIAYDAKIAPQSLKFSRALVTAYPSEENWRDAVMIHRDFAGLDSEATLDLLRLKRASRALHGERDYLETASAFSSAGLALEAKAVLDEGVSRKMVDAAKPSFKELLAQLGKRASGDKAALSGLQTKATTGAAALKAGDATYGSGDYTKAASLYRTAAQLGSIDANAANLRLGMALAQAGNRAEAEAALRAVSGQRAALASLWLAWLSRRA